MGQQISRDPGQPVGTEGIQAGLFNGIEQVCRIWITWLVALMDRRIVELPMEYDTVSKRTEAAVGGRGGLRQEHLGVIDVGERPRARS